MWYSGLIIVLVLLGISMASAIPAPDLHMPFDVNCVADISGNNHLTNITNVVGSTTAKIGNGSCYWAGQGSTSAMDVSGAVLDGASNTTITFWLRLDNQADDRDLIAKNAVNDRFTWISNVAYLQPSMKIGGGATFYSQNTSTVWTATWHHIGFTWNSTHKSYWLDGVKMNTTTVGAPFVSTGNYPMHVGWNGVNTNDKILGYVDDLCVWTDEVLVEQDFLDMWDGGTGAACNSSVPTTNYLEVTATNSYTTGEITTFNASINGTFYTTTNGTITTTIDQATASGVISVIVNATNYFSKSYSHEASTDLSAQLHQSEITFFAYNRVSGIALFTPITNTCTNCTNINNAADGNYNTFSSPKTNTSSYYYQNFTNANTLTVKANDKYGSGGTIANATIQAYNYSSAAWENFIQSNGTAISKTVPANYISSTHLQIRTNISSYAAGTLCVGSCVNGRFFEASAGTLTTTTTNNTATAARPTLNLSTGTYNINITTNNYYPTTTTITTSALEQSTTNISMYDHKLNITISGDGAVSDLTFTTDIYSLEYSFHEKLNTTTGYIIANLTAGDYTVWINDTTHTLKAVNITLNSTSNYTTLNIDVRTTNTFNITFWNETTNLQLTNTTVTWEIISDSEARNGTTNNGTLIENLLTPDSYEIIYYVDPLVRRSYFITLTNQTAEDIRLYTIDDSISDIYLPVVADADDQACAGNLVSLMRYYIDINGYRVVEMAQTDTNGQAVLHVQPNEINYKLLFSGSCGTFTTSPQKIVSSTDGFTVVQAQGLLTSSIAIANASISLNYINATQTYVFTWADNTGTVTEGCLNIFRTKGRVKTTNYSACSQASTGSLVYTLTGNLTNTEWDAQGTLETDTTYSFYTYAGESISFNTTIENWGVTGVFWGLILLLAIVMISSSTASGIIFSTIGTLIVLIGLGILAGTAQLIGGLVIIGVVILYKIKSS